MSRDRLQAWGRQLRLVHDELRAQAGRMRESVQDGEAGAETGLSAELTLFCLGFCGALTSHHVAEDERLFPRVLDARPGLGAVTARLSDDHRLLAALVKDLDHVARTAGPDEVLRHLDGISAIMESHFRYEERELTRVLDAMTAPEPDIRSLL
jgi:hemerythrin HHE cation binding domain-containing protein